MKTVAITLALLTSTAALAEEPKLQVKIDAAKPAVPPEKATADDAAMQKRAREAVAGYYKALIAGEYDAAATFLRDDTIEPVRAGLIKQIEAGAPKAQEATFQALGVASMAELRALPATKFFAAFARSQYGASIQQLANKDVAAQITVDGADCVAAERRCVVTFKVGGKGKDGKVAMVPQTMRASNVDGRWLLGFGP